MNHQLTLGVGLKDEATFANYYAGQNGPLIHELKKAAGGLGERVIYFAGVGGAGCTHLLQASCHEANHHKLSAVYLPLASLIEYSPAVFEGLENLELVCIDDVHMIAGRPAWEEAFFYLYNRLHDAGKRLIVSRLAWGVVFQIQGLTDTEKLQVLTLRAQRRGMTLPEDVGKYILNHCPRHMATLSSAFEALDKASLAAQRKLTIPFVKTVLQV
jgi:DnaA family protein